MENTTHGHFGKKSDEGVSLKSFCRDHGMSYKGKSSREREQERRLRGELHAEHKKPGAKRASQETNLNALKLSIGVPWKKYSIWARRRRPLCYPVPRGKKRTEPRKGSNGG